MESLAVELVYFLAVESNSLFTAEGLCEPPCDVWDEFCEEVEELVES